jgi:hypothetical protein
MRKAKPHHRPRENFMDRPLVTVVRRPTTAERRQKLVHLLAVLLDKPHDPDDGRGP